MSQGTQVNRWLINLDFFFMDFIIDTPLETSLEHIWPFMSTPEDEKVGNLLI